MLKRLLPKQNAFFALFQRAVDELVITANEFSNMLKNLHNQQHYVDLIATHEEEADQIALANYELLHKTFITPFDRYDMNKLTGSIDDIIDLINRIAQRFPFYNLTQTPEEMQHLADLSQEAAMHLKNAIYAIHSLKNADIIFKECSEIDRVEAKAHQVVLAGEKKLFDHEEDFKHFFKMKDIYAHTKQVINRCQDVGNILRGIVLEYS
jgi:uncharacterized protein Yka (UPF0111/DUF47 family)